ncbi:MAG: hypothetical protein ABDH21_06760 [bacterium]
MKMSLYTLVVSFFMILLYVKATYAQQTVVNIQGYMKFRYFIDVYQKNSYFVSDNFWKEESSSDLRFFFLSFTFHRSGRIIKYDQSSNTTQEIELDHTSKEYSIKIHKGNKVLDLWNSQQSTDSSDKSDSSKKVTNTFKFIFPKNFNILNFNIFLSQTQTNNQENLTIDYKPSNAIVNSQKIGAIDLHINYAYNNEPFLILIKLISSEELKNLLNDSSSFKILQLYLSKHKFSDGSQNMDISGIPLDNVLDAQMMKILQIIVHEKKDLIYSLQLRKNNSLIMESVNLESVKIVPFSLDDLQIPQGYAKKSSTN